MIRSSAWFSLALLSIGAFSVKLSAQTLDDQNRVIAIQQHKIEGLQTELAAVKNALSNLQASLADYLKKSEAGGTYITKSDANAQFTTDSEVIDKLKKCYIRLGYSKRNQTSPTVVGTSNLADTWSMTALTLPADAVANDKIYYDINCVPLILPPIVIRPDLIRDN